jgi:serine/threonine protein kinase
MEFVDGPSMAEVVADGPLEPRQVMDVVAQAAEALHAAHLAGLMHGDIKPANVLFSRDGVVKLTDAKCHHDAQPAVAVTGLRTAGSGPRPRHR